MSESRSRSRCFLIGAETLLMECGNYLLERGHDIRGVITSEPRIDAWARGHSLPVIDAGDDYRSALRAEPFDYLFTITHLGILPDEILKLPSKLAINFHDGPLPRYAGLNAPVWALMNREPSYGVTWHVLTSGVDAGDLLRQTEVEISPSETALSLNTKCLVAAMESFRELVPSLEHGGPTRTAQDLSQRSYFGKFMRPPAACAVDWSASALEVEAFVHALTYGPYWNPVGVPKTYRANAPERPFIVTAAEAVDDVDTAGDAGTVMEVGPEAVVVATGEGQIAILSARALDGRELTPADLTDEWRLTPGVVLGGAATDIGSRLTEAGEAFARHEEFWVRRLTEAEPPGLPQAAADAATSTDWAHAELDVPDTIAALFGEEAPVAVLLAFATYLARTGRKERFALSIPASDIEGLDGWYARHVPMTVSLDPNRSVSQEIAALRRELDQLRERGPFLRDLLLREPALSERPGRLSGHRLPVGVGIDSSTEDGHPGSALSLHVSGDGGRASVAFDRNQLSPPAIEAMRAGVSACLAAVCRDPAGSWTDLDLVPESVRRLQLEEWNRTEVDTPADRCVHHLLEAQADRTPDATAVVFRGAEVTYRELDERANRLAHFLRSRGVGPDTLVGVNVDRSVELLVATLGVLKAGGAYVPLDPDFPPERIAFMLEDSGAPVVITQESLATSLPETSAAVVLIDSHWGGIAEEPATRPEGGAEPRHLAYAIYTSGSTGTPKGVLVEHRNVVNFFTGMDAVIEHDPPGVWLAVTSLSFDISVLELFWTLATGFRVVVYKDPVRGLDSALSDSTTDPAVAARPMDFGLFMWGNDDRPAPSKYRLMIEAAKYFDSNGFDSVWTPERHFHAFGGPFPNPSVTGAAIAAVTERIAIRSGSCVSPLHHPIRIAEEWAVVDNLSNGRVGVSFASGWQPNDFVLRPESYPDNKRVMLEQIDVVRRLWRGEKVEFANPDGEMVAVTTLPRPVQEELPFWITTAGNPESYRQAGAMGANVLTHLLGQSLDEVREKIAIYREARMEAGFDPASGVVTLMLHTLVGEDDEEVRELVRQPMKDYLGASMKLVLGFAWSFPAFRRPGGPDAAVEDVDLSNLSGEEEEAILDFAFDRYFETSGLFGTPESCMRMVDRCKAIGVDEIACLLDFGVDTAVVLESLPHLKRVRDASNRRAEQGRGEAPGAFSFAEQVRRHRVTHLQCTPSMARMLADDASARLALFEIPHVMLGGEALPPGLARELLSGSVRTLTNMYGPTETTVWSSAQRIERANGPISIGRPIANTSIYVLDRYRQPLPVGVPGDLYIGGDGVTRGYHDRPDLSAERFIPDPYRGEGARMYWTGDLGSFQPDGTIAFLGRVDHQVKIRGYRIELGEIEARLERHDAVRAAVVTLHESRPGDQRLVAYVVPSGDAPDAAALRDELRQTLPEYMVPSRFVTIDRVPLTPNGKIDRNALPSPEEVPATPVQHVEPANELERTIAGAWCSTLGIEQVGVQQNFFDVGGHSLLVVQLHRKLRDVVSQPLSLVDLYRFPTIRSLTDHLTSQGSGAALEESTDRAEKRKRALAGMRRRRG